MRIARELAGYTMGEADILRRAMGKKIPAEMIPQREKFMKGAAERGITQNVAETDFRTGGKIRRLWLQQGPCRRLCPGRLPDRVSEGELSGRIPRRLDDAGYRQHRPAQHLPPGSAAAGRHASRRPTSTVSEAVFTCDAEAGTVFYALAAVKGVGRQAMDHVVEVRTAGGPFKSLSDFARRVDPQAGQQARLRKSGAGRAPSTASIPTAARWWKIPTASWAGRRPRSASAKAARSICSAAAVRPKNCACTAMPDWPVHERLGEEFGAMGFYLSGHPLDAYGAALKRLGAVDLCRAAGGPPPRRLQGQDRRHHDQEVRAARPQRPDVCLRLLLRSHRHVRGDAVSRSAGGQPAAAGSGQVAADHRQRRMGRRRTETARRLHHRSGRGRGPGGRGHGGAALGSPRRWARMAARAERSRARAWSALVVPGAPGEEVEIALPRSGIARDTRSLAQHAIASVIARRGRSVRERFRCRPFRGSRLRRARLQRASGQTCPQLASCAKQMRT